MQANTYDSFLISRYYDWFLTFPSTGNSANHSYLQMDLVFSSLLPWFDILKKFITGLFVHQWKWKKIRFRMTVIEGLEFEFKKYFLTSEILNNHVTFTNSWLDSNLLSNMLLSWKVRPRWLLQQPAPFELSLAGLPVLSIR